MLDIRAIRREFPIFDEKINGHSLNYLDTAATAQKPRTVIEAIVDYYQRGCGTINRALYPLSLSATKKVDEVRKKVQHFIGACDEREIIFTKSTTESINLLAISWGKRFVKQGDEIIISEMEHHANILPWQVLCRERGAVLRVIPLNSRGELDIAAYDALLSPKTKMVSVTHVSNVTGVENPVSDLAERAHRCGALIMVDGAQAVPHLPVIDVQRLGVDFYAFSGHKMYGPTGVGVLYGKRSLLEEIPPFLLGGDMVDRVSFDRSTFQPAPSKFEAGTPHLAGIWGLGAAIDYLSSADRRALAMREKVLLARALGRLEKIPGLSLFVSPARKIGVASFCIKGVHASDLGTMLGCKGIAVRTGNLCAQPFLHRLSISSLVRFSFGLYTTKEEVDGFISSLLEIIPCLKREEKATTFTGSPNIL